MNEAKAIETLGNIFHFETYTGENGNYELSSNYWDLRFNVRIDKTKIIIENIPGGTEQRIYFDDDETSIARSLMAFIGLVLRDESHSYTYDGTNGILAWPYSCNFAYIKTLKQNMDMNPGELEYQYAGRKAGLTNARKPIESVYNGLDEEVGDLQIDMTNTGYFEDGWLLLNVVGDGPYNINGYPDGTEFTINAYGPNGEDLGSKKFDFLELWHNGNSINSSRKPIKSGTDPNVNEDGTFTKEYIMDNPELFTQDVFDKYGISREDLLRKQYNIDSSMQGQERGIQAIMDEYGCSREEAIDIMNSEVTSGCHGKAKKKNKKEIKSSLVDEFEDSYCNVSNEWPEEERHSYEDSFINGFAKDHGITYDETKKMLDELQDKWYKDADNAGIVDIYSSTRRNITNINRIFG